MPDGHVAVSKLPAAITHRYIRCGIVRQPHESIETTLHIDVKGPFPQVNKR